MKNQWIKITGVLLLSVIMLSGIDAQPRYGKMHPTSLELAGEQEKQMKTLRLEQYKVMKPLKSKMAELKARERTLLSEEDVDMKSIHKVIDDQTALTNKMRKLQVEHRVAVREILTDEQIMKLDKRRKYVKRGKEHRNMG